MMINCNVTLVGLDSGVALALNAPNLPHTTRHVEVFHSTRLLDQNRLRFLSVVTYLLMLGIKLCIMNFDLAEELATRSGEVIKNVI